MLQAQHKQSSLAAWSSQLDTRHQPATPQGTQQACMHKPEQTPLLPAPLIRKTLSHNRQAPATFHLSSGHARRRCMHSGPTHTECGIRTPSARKYASLPGPPGKGCKHTHAQPQAPKKKPENQQALPDTPLSLRPKPSQRDCAFTCRIRAKQQTLPSTASCSHGPLHHLQSCWTAQCSAAHTAATAARKDPGRDPSCTLTLSHRPLYCTDTHSGT